MTWNAVPCKLHIDGVWTFLSTAVELVFTCTSVFYNTYAVLCVAESMFHNVSGSYQLPLHWSTAHLYCKKEPPSAQKATVNMCSMLQNDGGGCADGRSLDTVCSRSRPGGHHVDLLHLLAGSACWSPLQITGNQRRRLAQGRYCQHIDQCS